MNARETAGFTGPPTDRTLYRIADVRSFRRGGVGVVYEATLTSERYGVAAGAAVGVKLLTGVDAERFAKLAERSHLLRSQPHPRLARHIECFVGPPVSPEEVPEEDATQFFSVHEWVSGSSLHDRIESASVDEILAWSEDVAAALDQLHSLPGGGFAHRDVHARNIIVEPDGRARLIDFDTILWGEAGDTSLTSLQHGVARRPEHSALEAAQAQDRAALALTLLRALARDTTSGSPITELTRLSYENLAEVTPSRHELVATLIRAVQDPPATAAELVETVREHSALTGRGRRLLGKGSARKEMARLEAIATGTTRGRRVLPIAAGVLVLVSAGALAWGVAAPLSGEEKDPADAEVVVTAPREALRASKVFAAGDRTCVIESVTQDLLCWGSLPQQNATKPVDGQPPTWDTPSPQWATENQAPQGEFHGVDDYAIGDGHRCALRRGGVVCAGENDMWQLGLEPVGEFPTRFNKVGVVGATQVAAGGDTTCALADGHARCWGAILAPGSDRRPEDAYGIEAATDLSMSGSRACVVEGGSVVCWGLTSTDPEILDPVYQQPTRVDGIQKAVSVVVGHSTACAVTSTGDLFCWGENTWTGKDYDGLEHVGVTKVSGFGPVTAVAIGGGHICAISTEKAVRCLGMDHSGQLGLDGHEAGDVRTSDGVLTSVTSIAAGSDHTCAIRTDDSVWCWGAGRSGQIGNGATAAQPRATRVELAVTDPEWLLEPGSYGPLEAGMQATDAVRTGLVMAADPTASCDPRWEPSVGLSKDNTMLEFGGGGDPADLDHVLVSDHEVKTVKGIHPGSAMEDLSAAYGDDLQTFTTEGHGGEVSLHLVFGEKGALGFVEDFERPGKIRFMFVSVGTTVDDVRVPFGGC